MAKTRLLTAHQFAAAVVLGAVAVLLPVAGDEPTHANAAARAASGDDDTAAACGACHKDQYAEWRRRAHQTA